MMLGRGILANPALARMLSSGPAATRDELARFHDRLLDAYEAEMGGNAVCRMKEWWSYAKYAFADPLSVHRTIRKARKLEEYRAATARVFCSEELASVARFQG